MELFSKVYISRRKDELNCRATGASVSTIFSASGASSRSTGASVALALVMRIYKTRRYIALDLLYQPMHIKRIVIQGFKTYKNTTVIDVLSPQHNVVVGRNGSGKSNFFSAIRFVLSDAYTHMSREERQSLIHEGSGTVMSAYVEIVFDNTDRRLPVARDEVAVRRTIGLKKDDYSLDGKSATRSDVMNLLESAGFSRSNPYYIVPQGKITALTNAKDSDRLALLKDVSGAKVFEAKLKESLKEMDHSNMKRQRIDETLATIDERLDDLQIESHDLKEFQHQEKLRKILEFNLFDRELTDLEVELGQLEEKYAELVDQSRTDLVVLENLEKSCDLLASSISELKNQLRLVSMEKDQDHVDYTQLLTTISAKEVKLDQLKSDMAVVKENREAVVNSIAHFQGLITKTKGSISDLKPLGDSLHTQESELKQKLVLLSTRQRALYSKQSRFQKFSSKAQRDKWLNEEIGRLSKDLGTKEVEIGRLEGEMTGKKEEIMELTAKETDLNAILNDETREKEVVNLHQAINGLKLALSTVSDTRKGLWRDEIRYRSIHDSLTNDLNNASHVVNLTMDRLQSQGLEAVRELTTSLGLQNSVYGPLAELFSVSDKYKTAVEVIGGNSLFHVVVDTDETASVLMEQLVRAKRGRVTFMPLNRLGLVLVEYPDSNEHQCIPLIKKVKSTNPAVSRAIQQVFGRTIVVSELSKGSELARAYKLSAITLDGDRADVKGALTGGYRDYKSSRLDAIKSQVKKKKQLLENSDQLNGCEAEITRVNQEFTALNNQLVGKTKELDRQLGAMEAIRSELGQIANKKYNLDQELSSLESNYEAVVRIKQNLVTNLHEHRQELGSEFSQTLSEEEHQLMKQLTQEINQYETELDKVVNQSAEVDTKLAKYESDLLMNFRPHLAKLVLETRGGMNEYEVEELGRELDRLYTKLDEARAKTNAADREIESLQAQIESKETELATAKADQTSVMKRLEKFSKSSEKHVNKKSILSSRREEVQRKIRDIGVLPEEAFDQEKYEQFGSDELLAQLNRANESLKQYVHINKKAIDQYSLFTGQRDELVGRRQELDEGRESITGLIKSLELQKEEAIGKSFRAVAKSFSEVFGVLVPEGRGRLVMELDLARQGQERDESDPMDLMDETQDQMDQVLAQENPGPGGPGFGPGFDDYTGVSISVSFNSKTDEQLRIEQLSGGQKSLCAIALILAIQKCDPAPFYLFDEIDANLDTQYRTAVLAMISGLSSTAQFICTTFRPEMLAVAHKFYGVSYGNKVSSVSEIGRDIAASFVGGGLTSEAS